MFFKMYHDLLKEPSKQLRALDWAAYRYYLAGNALRDLSWIPMLLENGRARYEALSGVLHHVHLKVGLVGRPIRTVGALMHRLFAAFVRHVPPQVLHLMITAIAVVTGEATLAATSAPISHRSCRITVHLPETCNHEEHFINIGRISSGMTFSSSQLNRENKLLIIRDPHLTKSVQGLI